MSSSIKLTNITVGLTFATAQQSSCSDVLSCDVNFDLIQTNIENAQSHNNDNENKGKKNF